MKRSRGLWIQVMELENLYSAFWKARKGKEHNAYVQDYRKNLDYNLLNLQQKMACGCNEIGSYSYFKIFDPKERLICAARFSERVLHHAIMNICHASFESYQIFDSYASRKGKGQYAALDRAQRFQREHKWFLKLDVRKYFDSVDHDTLYGLLARRFKDPELLGIFRRIIDSYHVTNGRGIPIGNLTSQYFANHYLGLSDHYVKEQLGAPAYVRYMDDMVLWHNDSNKLSSIGHAFSNFISHELKLELKPLCMNKTIFGLPFLGYVVYPCRMRLSQRSRSRFKKKLKLYQSKLSLGLWSESEYQKHILPLLAFVEKAESGPYRKTCLEEME